MPHPHRTRLDSDIRKGAFETEEPSAHRNKSHSNNSLSGQIGHRNKHEDLHEADTDFPEPNASGEHSGQTR